MEKRPSPDAAGWSSSPPQTRAADASLRELSGATLTVLVMRLFRRQPAQATLGHITTAWGLLFAVVHAYWAAGGALGTNGDPADTPGAQSYIAVIAVLGVVGAAVAHGLVHDWAARLGRRRLVLLARAGGAALLVGVVIGAGRWLVDGTIEADGAAGVVTTLYFLLGGLLFSTLGRRRSAPASGPALQAA
jgi:hypothetical protein